MFNSSMSLRHSKLIKSPANGDFTMACPRTYPSYTGTAVVWVAPLSNTRPVDLPLAKLTIVKEDIAFIKA